MSGVRTPLVIVNPRAGGGRAGRTFSQVRAVIEGRLGPVDVATTDRPGHAIELARDAAREGRSLIVAVGGDGTLHEVVNGVLDAGGDTAVGYVGQGTGGDFRRTLGVEHRLDRYVGALAHGREKLLDVGKVTFRSRSGATDSRWFVNVLSAGVGGLVDQYVARTTKAFGGTAAYFWAGLRALASCQHARLTCTRTLDGRRDVLEFGAYLVAICNGRFFGSGMHVAPMADVQDGRLEVIVMDAPSKVAFAACSRTIYRGGHLSAPCVKHFACNRISLDLVGDYARDVFLLDVDGEPLGSLPLEVEVAPAALRVRV
ncbi:MAG TPA: diacylglycerol kinase family protein [Polyangiaceae bacterium]|nr:diacylglycerol kinase family protein [Polyangiaceae bacterium]